MTVNGQKVELKNEITIKEYLSNEGYNIDTIAVLLNDEVIAKDNIDNILLKDSDIMEIVNFVGGGK